MFVFVPTIFAPDAKLTLFMDSVQKHADENQAMVREIHGSSMENKMQIAANREDITTINKTANMLLSSVVDVKSQVVDVKAQVEGVVETVEEFREEMKLVRKEVKDGNRDSAATSLQTEFRSGPGRKYLPYAHHWFDGATGNNCICPVSFTDHNRRERELVILSVALMTKFYIEEVNDSSSKDEVLSFIKGETFVRATGLSYKDVVKGLLLTGFKFRAVGRGCNQMRRENMARFVLVEAEFYKELLGDVKKYFPRRPLTRDFIMGGRAPNYRVDGTDYGFLVTETDQSTGYITQISRSISAQQKTTMVCMGEPFVKEWYTPLFGKLFDVPAEMLGKYHITSSVIDPSGKPVKCHRQAQADYIRRQENKKNSADLRKRKREEKSRDEKTMIIKKRR